MAAVLVVRLSTLNPVVTAMSAEVDKCDGVLKAAGIWLAKQKKVKVQLASRTIF